MFETSAEQHEFWRGLGGAQALRPTPAPLDVEVLALLCPDWRDAMLVLDADSREVAYANIGAIEMFKRRAPLSVRHGRLELSSPRDAERLTKTLQHALRKDIAKSSIVIDDEANGHTWCVRIFLPQGFMRDTLRRNLHGAGRLVVLEVSAGQVVLSRADLNALGEAFALTVAETNILALLGQGRSLGEIATMRSVELETVRAQCKLLLAKTRCRKQSELVKLVVALCAHDAASAD